MQISASAPLASTLSQKDPRLWDLSKKLEANFVANMLSSAGFGEGRDTLGGGVGENQFSSFLVQEYSTSMVDAGGFGLSEAIYRSLVANAGIEK